MDTSVEYIEMCRKAIEVQKVWKPCFGDFVFADGSKIVTQVAVDTELIEFIILDSHIWLPRQDQLQDILRLHFDCTHENLRDAFEVFTNNKPMEWEIWTNEELWLAFVMWIKFQKKWNGSDWVNE